ncbi:MAG: hypothetical protein AB7Q69_04805 [Gemmatimonadales bacterium]
MTRTTDDRWREVERLFDAALERDPAERDSFLEAAGVDRDTRREVRELLRADRASGEFVAEVVAAEARRLSVPADADAAETAETRVSSVPGERGGR